MKIYYWPNGIVAHVKYFQCLQLENFLEIYDDGPKTRADKLRDPTSSVCRQSYGFYILCFSSSIQALF